MPSYPIQVPDGSPFPVENIPFGIFSPANDSRKRAGTAIGEHVVDLAVLEKHGSFSSVSPAFGNIFSAVMSSANGSTEFSNRLV